MFALDSDEDDLAVVSSQEQAQAAQVQPLTSSFVSVNTNISLP